MEKDYNSTHRAGAKTVQAFLNKDDCTRHSWYLNVFVHNSVACCVFCFVSERAVFMWQWILCSVYVPDIISAGFTKRSSQVCCRSLRTKTKWNKIVQFVFLELRIEKSLSAWFIWNHVENLGRLNQRLWECYEWLDLTFINTAWFIKKDCTKLSLMFTWGRDRHNYKTKAHICLSFCLTLLYKK